MCIHFIGYVPLKNPDTRTTYDHNIGDLHQLSMSQWVEKQMMGAEPWDPATRTEAV